MSRNSDDQITSAVELIQAEQYKEAVELLETYLKGNPDSLEAWYNYGCALMGIDRLEDAVKAYDEALAIDNMIFEIWFNKASSLHELADFKKAKECYEKALEINSEDAEAWNNLGNSHSRMGNGRAAIEAYTRAVALKPDYAEAFYNKANAHFIEQEDQHAIAYAEVALELDSSLETRVSQWIHVSRARLVSAQDQREYHRARKEKKKISELDIRDSNSID
ncbi:MAG: tetratricopeptide repeat protein [Candidatus Thorarchaeota archaeon]